jgi:uncharacterized phage protein gp47/JayE
MASGLTTTGFVRKILDEIVADLGADERGRLSGQIDLSERTVLGNLNAVFGDHLSQVWEAFEELVRQFDPDNALDDRLVSLALLSGVERRGATSGLVTATVNLDASFAFAAGDLVAHVADQPDNRWVNRDAVSSTGAGNYSVVFESEDTGAGASAASGTLSVIAQSATGWNSVTNALDATPGTDEESIEDLRARREASLSLAGSATVDAIRADVLQVDGVLQVLVEENTTDAATGGLSPHSFRVVVWDGDPAAADEDEIAQAIHDTRPAGIPAVGSTGGSATTADGQVVNVAFERATAVDIYVDVDIVSETGVSIADVKAAILAAAPTRLGEDVIFNRISAAVFSVDGVDDFDFVQIGTAPSPSGTANIAISNTQIALFDSANIVVTGDAS